MRLIRTSLPWLCLILGTTGYGQVSVFGNPYFDQTVTQTEIMNAGPVFGQQTVVFPATQTFNFGGTTNKTVQATHFIRIEPGFAQNAFKIGPFTAGGKMKLEIAKTDFAVVAMDYTGLTGILKNQRFELGVGLPPDILTKVNNFVYTPDNGGQKLNPYLEWELKVQTVFAHPNEPQPIVIDGFYTKEFDSWMVTDDNSDPGTDPQPLPAPGGGPFYQSFEYTALGGWNEQLTPYPFRVRFSPPRTGVWKAYVVITASNGTVTYTSPQFEFNVIESGKHGYITVGADKRYLSLDGHSFYPVGANTPWPETNTTFDPELRALMPHGEDYWSVGVRPRVYEKYRGVMSTLADNGANYMRTIMSPTATEIEYEKLGNYTNRLTMADEMDKVLELAEAKDFFLHWNCHIHYTFDIDDWRPHNFYATTETGNPYCYNAANNGGLTGSATMTQFFTDTEAKKYYKQRLRYILARWGYSTNIGAFELFSEISNVRSTTNNEGYDVNYAIYRDWQVEMGNYVKTFYNGKKHLLTCSYGGNKNADPNDANGGGMNPADNTFNNSCFDIMGSNVYDFGELDGAKEIVFQVSEKMLNGQTSSSYIQNNSVGGVQVPNIKPLMLAETDVYEGKCDPYKIEFKRNMWQYAFSGLATTLTWDGWYHPAVYSTFINMRNFMSQFDLSGESFYPGASTRDANDSFDWNYEQSYANDMGLDNSDKADISYLRSADGNTAIGVMSNKTMNSYTLGNQCITSNLVDWHTAATVNVSNAVGDEHLTLRGLNFGEYTIHYYFASSAMTEVHTSTAWGPQLPIDADFTTTDPNKALILFIAQKNNAGREALKSASAEMEAPNPGFVVYPNPANTDIYISLENPTREVAVKVLSLDGRLCREATGIANGGKLFIGDLDPSTYIVQCYTDGNFVGQQKIVKL